MMMRALLHFATVTILAGSIAACGWGSSGDGTAAGDTTSAATIRTVEWTPDALAATQSGTTSTKAATTSAAATTTTTAAATTTSANAASSSTVAPVGQSAGAWTLTFSDEFNGSSYDSTKWSAQIWYGDKNADGTVNYDVSGGALRIWPALNRSGQFFDRTFVTDGKFAQKYGYFEARMKLPRGRGVWPAFWLFGHYDGQVPYRPEIDILEAYPGEGLGYSWGTTDLRPIQYGVTFHTDSGSDASRVSDGPFKVDTPDLSAAYHVYGFKWEAGGQMTWYFDGVQKGTRTVPGFDNHALAIYLDLWFGSASGTPNTSETPMGPSNAFEVDYVRVWR